MKEKKENLSKVKIKHHLADGEIRESVKGHKVRVNNRTIAAYRILAQYGKSKE
ncbi:MAG TPA: hypothetical protein PK033_11820 [Acetivibrio sp.]|jgi:hypothetical protein|nr:hypothetical protein [Clostridium sp.]HOQ36144.1 hypothetical protein [Acetivibrio sp.]HPT90921.1 hypothetical protein [Acetivibrio sp.]HQA58550.1 hypothetical protein [Acetivibrio sp.]